MREIPQRYLIGLGRAVGLLIVAMATVTGAWVWILNVEQPRTNDAMVRANVVDVVLQHVNGTIQELNIADNQRVRQGDLLYAIDRRPYEARAAAAEAELRLAEKEVAGQLADIRAAEARIQQTEHEVAAAEADIARLEAEARYAGTYLKRIEPLLQNTYIAPNTVSQAAAAQQAAAAAVRDARSRRNAVMAALETARQDRRKAEARIARFGDAYARIQAAEAKLRTAQLDLGYCTVHAQFDGYVTNLNISVGQFVQPGQKLFALVDDRAWYVIANYKETYLRSIRPGMAVDVFLAPYPGRHFRGVVQGIGWANYPDNVKEQGALPEIHRTLNWVVLAARFPVRITLLDRDPEHPFRMGMTAYTRILGTAAAAAPPLPL